MNEDVQTRVRQPLGLVEVIDRSASAIEDYPDTKFILDEHGIIHWPGVASRVPAGREIRGGSYTLFTRVWLGLAPPTKREPGYVAVVGEMYETHLPQRVALQGRVRPIFLLDEYCDFLLPRLMVNAANLKDIYCPYIDRADLNHKTARHDPFYQLLIWPEEELLKDVQKQHYGLTCYPDPEDLDDTQAGERWPWFRSRHHVVPAVLPPYKSDPEKLYQTVDALLGEKNEAGQELFGVHSRCETWAEDQYQTPHMAVAMVAASFQRWDWVERVSIDAADRDYAEPTKDEVDEMEWEQMVMDASMETVLYSALGTAERARLLAGGMGGYRQLIGFTEEPTAAEREQDDPPPGGSLVVPR